jgi:broad specificity phosphatase PhoE
MERAVGGLASRHEGKTIGVVSHGAATRAYATGVLGLDFSQRLRLGLLHNTAMARVVYGPRGPAMASWNLTPHLRD